MRELEYQLVKDDYKNWIHWNVLRNESKKMKIFSLVIYVGFVVIYVGGSLNSAKGNMAALIPSIGMALLVGAAMFYTTSHQNQERMIWKKSGLKRLEKNNNFPVVHLTLNDLGLVMEVPSENVTKEYRYSELFGILEIERLFLLEANDKTWQFIAKSAFSSQEEMDEFKAFMEEKIADAKENPEKYEKKEEIPKETQKAGDNGADASYEGGSASGSDEEVEEIEPVDTSNMGKIGKMAHIIAAMAAEAENEDGDSVRTEESAHMASDDEAVAEEVTETASEAVVAAAEAATEDAPEQEVVSAAEADGREV
ncbi:YcxB family protein [[Clostridium] symbiosum]|uniref:YcxB family protein n=1 Tax=Clostridium symbiosum TaxID=1512 RepID=UPI001D068E6F|nr:YcxB family protein [[Clostridium] symbiosum]MCB6610950.1 YcxB family protein [[Clostridium] symbiosum]MCB6932092.1 YcxB family protein [[Clostridium] symbiosum]